MAKKKSNSLLEALTVIMDSRNPAISPTLKRIAQVAKRNLITSNSKKG